MIILKRKHIVAVMACLLASALPIFSQNSSQQSPYQIAVDASKQWIDTNIDLRAGEKLSFTASGEITYPLKEARTATGGAFNSDGRILVLVLRKEGTT